MVSSGYHYGNQMMTHFYAFKRTKYNQCLTKSSIGALIDSDADALGHFSKLEEPLLKYPKLLEGMSGFAYHCSLKTGGG